MPVKDSSDISSLLRYKWFRAGWLAVQSLLGWPMYLLFNAGGREYSRFTSHFDPLSPIFSRRERPGVSASVDLLCWQCMCRTGSACAGQAQRSPCPQGAGYLVVCPCQQAPRVARATALRRRPDTHM